MNDYFCNALASKPDLLRIPAAALLKEAKIYRSFEGDFVIILKSSQEFRKITSPSNLAGVSAVLREVYGVDGKSDVIISCEDKLRDVGAI